MEWTCNPVLLQKQPRVFFNLQSHPDGLDLRTYSQQVAAALQDPEAWDSQAMQWLETVPQTLLYFTKDQEVPSAALPILLQNLWVIYQMHSKQPDAQLELLLLTSAEYTYYLLLDHQAGQVTLSHDYLYCLDCMLQDPFWAMRWAFHTRDTAFYRRLLEHIQHAADYHPRCAAMAHILTCYQQDRVTALQDVHKRLTLLIQDPILAIWLHKQYPELELPALVRSAVGHYPALLYWALHSNGQELDLILRELQRHPAWLADYLNQRRPPDAATLWQSALSRFQNKWLQPWLAHLAY